MSNTDTSNRFTSLSQCRIRTGMTDARQSLLTSPHLILHLHLHHTPFASPPLSPAPAVSPQPHSPRGRRRARPPPVAIPAFFAQQYPTRLLVHRLPRQQLQILPVQTSARNHLRIRHRLERRLHLDEPHHACLPIAARADNRSYAIAGLATHFSRVPAAGATFALHVTSHHRIDGCVPVTGGTRKKTAALTDCADLATGSWNHPSHSLLPPQFPHGFFTCVKGMAIVDSAVLKGRSE